MERGEIWAKKSGRSVGRLKRNRVTATHKKQNRRRDGGDFRNVEEAGWGRATNRSLPIEGNLGKQKRAIKAEGEQTEKGIKTVKKRAQLGARFG